MAKVLLGVTGSVAAIYTPQLYADLTAAGHSVKVSATTASLYFFDFSLLGGGNKGQRDPEAVILDADEWPRADSIGPPGYQRGDPVLHIELRRWAEVLLVAPLDAHTLGKFALGLTDNCLTCVYRAWDRNKPIVLAPAMNTLMWEHPATARHLRQIAEDMTGLEAPALKDPLAMVAWINTHCPTLSLVPPQTKRLACDDVGVGALAERPEILMATNKALELELRKI